MIERGVGCRLSHCAPANPINASNALRMKPQVRSAGDRERVSGGGVTLLPPLSYSDGAEGKSAEGKRQMLWFRYLAG